MLFFSVQPFSLDNLFVGSPAKLVVHNLNQIDSNFINIFFPIVSACALLSKVGEVCFATLVSCAIAFKHTHATNTLKQPENRDSFDDFTCLRCVRASASTHTLIQLVQGTYGGAHIELFYFVLLLLLHSSRLHSNITTFRQGLPWDTAWMTQQRNFTKKSASASFVYGESQRLFPIFFLSNSVCTTSERPNVKLSIKLSNK